jgi:hypothetical protein
LHRWFFTEIITFYGLLASAIVYLLFAAVFHVKTDKFVFFEERTKTDFITWSQELYRYFGICNTLLLVSIITYAIYDGQACKGDNLNNPGSALIPTHLCQVLSLIAVIFFIDRTHSLANYVFYGGLLVIPFVSFIYIAIATGVTAEGVCQRGLKSWLITDCVVFAWMLPDYFA